jgi:hypothetical protein
MRDVARIVVRRRPSVFACIGVTIGVSIARDQRRHVSAAVQEDEIPFSMSMVECRRAEETDVARRVSTLVSCRPLLSTGIAVSFAVKAAIKVRPPVASRILISHPPFRYRSSLPARADDSR